jgi:hypothetical protein
MNKILVILLALVVQAAFAQVVWDGTADTTWFTNKKSAKEFTITTAKQLAGLAKLVNGGAGNGTYDMQGKTINLGATIMLNDTTNWIYWAFNSPAKTWLPIGSKNRPFKGIFDGKGHKGTFDGEGNKVVGAYTKSVSDYQGLFGYVGSGGAIKNLVVYASHIGGRNYVGGLVGNNLGGEISFSYFGGIVAGIEYVGGFVGKNGGKIARSYSNGGFAGNKFVGGFVGYNSDDDGNMIEHCYSIGTVMGERSAVGGFSGVNRGIIGYSYSTSSVNGDSIVGGFVGENSGTIGNSYSSGMVVGKRAVGGLVGYNDGDGGIISSYSIGIVPKKENSIGGLVGNNEGKIEHSYYNKQTSTQNDNGKGIGKTTEQLKQKETFAGWDFKKVWDMKSETNDGYPSLVDFLER